jgi:CRP/FNR family transcriptional regulator
MRRRIAIHPEPTVVWHEHPSHDHAECNMSRLCGFAGGCSMAAIPIDPLIASHKKVRRGTQLFHTDDEFKNLFAVRNGFFKTVVRTQDGREQVTGFQMAGDLIGLDGLASKRYTGDVVALEDSEVCVLPFERIRAAGVSRPALHDQLHSLMAAEIVRNHAIMLMLGHMSAEERVAAFLADLLERLSSRGWSGSEMVLRMSRHEIGSYLGLTLESVSRVISLLADQGIIRVKIRHIEVLDAARLQHLSACAVVPIPRPQHRLSASLPFTVYPPSAAIKAVNETHTTDSSTATPKISRE